MRALIKTVVVSSVIGMSGVAFAAPSLSVTCSSGDVTFAMSSLDTSSAVTLYASDDNSTWDNLGSDTPSSASLSVTVPNLASVADNVDNISSATFKVSQGSDDATATCP